MPRDERVGRKQSSKQFTLMYDIAITISEKQEVDLRRPEALPGIE